jgi:hypothetical protein
VRRCLAAFAVLVAALASGPAGAQEACACADGYWGCGCGDLECCCQEMFGSSCEAAQGGGGGGGSDASSGPAEDPAAAAAAAEAQARADAARAALQAQQEADHAAAVARRQALEDRGHELANEWTAFRARLDRAGDSAVRIEDLHAARLAATTGPPPPARGLRIREPPPPFVPTELRPPPRGFQVPPLRHLPVLAVRDSVADRVRDWLVETALDRIEEHVPGVHTLLSIRETLERYRGYREELSRLNQETIDATHEGATELMRCMAGHECDAPFVHSIVDTRAGAYVDKAREWVHEIVDETTHPEEEGEP